MIRIHTFGGLDSIYTFGGLDSIYTFGGLDSILLNTGEYIQNQLNSFLRLQ